MKKKIIALVLAVALCVSLAVLPAGASAANVQGKSVVMQIGNTTAWVDGNAVQLKEAPCIIDGRTMLPFRALAEALDCNVEWVPGSERIIVTKQDGSDYKAIYQIGNIDVYRHTDTGEDMYYRMDVAPVLSQSGNTLLPARYVAELLGYTTNWADTLNAAVIYNDNGAIKLSDVKAKMTALLMPLDSSVIADSFTCDEERFASDVYSYLNQYLVMWGDRRLAWNSDLELVCNQRAYEREAMDRWITNDNISLLYSADRQKIYENACGTYYIPETEFCLGESTDAKFLIQQAHHNEDEWKVLTNKDYSQVAVSAVKHGGTYRVLILLSGTGIMR